MRCERDTTHNKGTAAHLLITRYTPGGAHEGSAPAAGGEGRAKEGGRGKGGKEGAQASGQRQVCDAQESEMDGVTRGAGGACKDQDRAKLQHLHKVDGTELRDRTKWKRLTAWQPPSLFRFEMTDWRWDTRSIEAELAHYRLIDAWVLAHGWTWELDAFDAMLGEFLAFAEEDRGRECLCRLSYPLRRFRFSDQDRGAANRVDWVDAMGTPLVMSRFTHG